MAHREACQVYIEQEIQAGLKQGKTPYSIGKELSGWVEKLFEAQIPADTIKHRASRMQEKLGTNVPNRLTNINHSQSHEIQVAEHGGAREGAGRAPKYAAPPPQIYSDADQFATIAISQLTRIRSDDPKRVQALQRVKAWVDAKIEEFAL